MGRATRERASDQTERSRTDDEMQRCPECNSTDLVTDRGERLCKACGLVLDDEPIDRGPEWRAFDHLERDRKSRAGAPETPTIHDKGLTTQIAWKNEDAAGHSLDSRKKNRMHRLRKWQERIRTQNAGERNLQFALSETARMASALGVPDSVREVASVLYRRALTEDLIRGRSIEGMASACLYASCRKEGVPRTLEEVATVSRVDQMEIGRAYRYLADELDLEIRPTDPKAYLPRFASDLDLSAETIAEAREIVDAAADHGLLSGRSPSGFAAAAIYAASLLCNEKRTQQEVADVANVTKVTIRNRYREQLDAIDVGPSA